MINSPTDIVLANINFINEILDIIEKEEIEEKNKYIEASEINIKKLEELGAVIHKVNNRYYLKSLNYK